MTKIDLYRQLMTGLLVQSGGELRIKQEAINAIDATMEISQTADPENGDIILELVQSA